MPTVGRANHNDVMTVLLLFFQRAGNEVWKLVKRDLSVFNFSPLTEFYVG